MEYRQLGKTALKVPVIGMGTWRTFDVRGSKDESYRTEIVRTAYEHGINFYDSSPMYGQSERVLGQSVKELGIRDKIMIATKVWTDSDIVSEHQFDDAFKFFGGYVDLYQVHNLVAWKTRLDQLEALKAKGKVKAIGITHYSHSAFGDMMRIMETARVETIQIPYNAIDRIVEKEVLPLAEQLQIGVIVMRPFGEGSLLRRMPHDNELKEFEQYGVTTWPQILLKWILSDKRISTAIPATSHAERIIENAKAGEGPWFDEDVREAVSRLARKYS
jgi:aryl-alcohol dehydrogenase-like predicted oxidoreductase